MSKQLLGSRGDERCEGVRLAGHLGATTYALELSPADDLPITTRFACAWSRRLISKKVLALDRRPNFLECARQFLVFYEFKTLPTARTSRAALVAQAVLYFDSIAPRASSGRS
jgi:hypothetical protein